LLTELTYATKPLSSFSVLTGISNCRMSLLHRTCGPSDVISHLLCVFQSVVFDIEFHLKLKLMLFIIGSLLRGVGCICRRVLLRFRR